MTDLRTDTEREADEQAELARTTTLMDRVTMLERQIAGLAAQLTAVESAHDRGVERVDVVEQEMADLRRFRTSPPNTSDYVHPSTLPWRVGRRVKRTVYQMVGEQPSSKDQVIGMMDTPELAAYVVAAVNFRRHEDDEVARLADYLTEHYPSEIGTGSAVDTATRLLQDGAEH